MRTGLIVDNSHHTKIKNSLSPLTLWKTDGPVNAQALLFQARASLTLAFLQVLIVHEVVLGIDAGLPSLQTEGSHRLLVHAVLQVPELPLTLRVHHTFIYSLHAVHYPGEHWHHRGNSPWRIVKFILKSINKVFINNMFYQ